MDNEEPEDFYFEITEPLPPDDVPFPETEEWQRTEGVISPQVYPYENGWEIKFYGSPDKMDFWIAEKPKENFAFEDPVCKTRIFRDKESAVKYVEENINE